MAPLTRQELGRRAEDAVAEWLELRGFEILQRNLRLGHLEIDIVARRDELAAMVEVRTRGRGARERALASVAGKKKMHLLNAADRLWRFHLAKLPGIERMRIDVASVTFDGRGGARVEYIAGAIAG